MKKTGTAMTLVACLWLSACDFRDSARSERFSSDFHYSYALNPGGRLEVDNFDGPVEIAGWDEARCEISGTKYAGTPQMLERLKVDVTASGNLIYVRSVRPAGESVGNLGVRYAIRVPRKVELSRISSSNGEIRVLGTEGRAELETSNGSVTAEEVAGAMIVRTSNGAIRLEDKVVAEIRAHTNNGSIRVRLPAAASAKVRMETNNGHVRSDFEPGDTQGKQHHRRQSLEEVIGGGGPLIDLRTSNGSIELLKM